VTVVIQQIVEITYKQVHQIIIKSASTLSAALQFFAHIFTETVHNLM